MRQDQDHNDPEEKALRTIFFQSVNPAASLLDEVQILRNSLLRTFTELESPTLTEPGRIRLLRRAGRLDQKINLILLQAQSTIVGLRFFTQQMQAMINVMTDLGDDITEAKLRERLEPLGIGTASNEPLPQSSASESKVSVESTINALQSLSLTNTQGSSSTSISSDAKLEKDESDKSGINKSSQR